MRKINSKIYPFLIISLIVPNLLFADGKTEAGLTLLEAPGARAASLGEAFSTMPDAVTAFVYNPAALESLQSGDASFLYHKGLADDSFGRLNFGMPGRLGSFGLSVGYYDGGDVDLFDGTTQKTVTAQKDLTLALGVAKNLGPVSLGLTGKYLSSEIGETAKGSAVAADLGMIIPVYSRIRFGAAYQNLGSGLKYNTEDNDLPEIARAGLSFLVIPTQVKTTLLIEAPYHVNPGELKPSIGLESMVGPMAFRAGYQGGRELEGFSAGAGFMLGQFSLDYAFGLVDELDSRHRVSLGLRFGSKAESESFSQKKLNKEENQLVSQPKQKTAQPTPSITVQEEKEIIKTKIHQAPTQRIYVVKPGDTLSKISRRIYGNSSSWRKIYQANRHIIDNPRKLVASQKLVLP